MKKRLACLCLLLGGAVFAQENYSTAWTRHKNVILNTAPTGANVTANVVNFPVLVRLGVADSAIFSQSKAGGADLRFTKFDNTTRLSHQIESWDATAKSAAIWVLVDTIKGNVNNGAIRMHWGNSAAMDSSSGSQVFKTANGFQAVYHMNGTTNESDATANGFTATQSGAAASVAGSIGNGRQFNGGSDYFTAAGTAASSLNFPENGTYTLSAWVNADLVAHAVVISKHDRDYALKLDNNLNFEFFEYGTMLQGWNAVNAPAEGNVWKHVVGVQNGADAALYIDGARADYGIITTCSNCSTTREETFDVVIGAEPTSATAVRRFFSGVLDEVRLSNVSRSADWAKLEFENQKAAQTLVKLLDTVPTPLRPALAAKSGNGFSVKPAGNGLAFRIEGAKAAKARVSIMDMWGRTVWSRQADLQGNQLTWDGLAANGQQAPQGVYAVRISLLNAQGKPVQTLEKKVPFTR